MVSQGISLWEVELIIEDSTQQLVLSALGELLERIGVIKRLSRLETSGHKGTHIFFSLLPCRI